jgi:uncharacterized membrane protein
MGSRQLLCALALALTACGGGERPAAEAAPESEVAPAPVPAATPDAPQALLRGLIRLDPIPMFRSCDLAINARFEDKTAIGVIPLSRRLTADTEEFFVLVRGTYSPQQNVILEEIEFAAVSGSTNGCEQPAPDYIIFARGGEPAWSLRVTDSGIEFTEADSTTLQLPPVAPRNTEDRTVVYQASTNAGVLQTLSLTLRRTGCYEGSEAYTATRAEVVIDGRTFTGCAWRGRLP